MRVVLNTLATLKPKTGVGHYAARLAAGMPEVTTFPEPVLAHYLRKPAGGRPGAGANHWLRDIAKQAGWHALEAMFRFRYRGYDLYHEPNFLPFDCGLPTVVTVHDLSVLLHPEWHPADRVRRHEVQFRRGVRRAAHVITVSDVVRREVIQHLGVAPDRVTAVANGVGDEYFNVSVPRGNYLLYVGTIEPRKNLLTLLKAYCSLPASLRERCPLQLVGGWGWRAEEIAAYYEDVARHRNVSHLGYVADADLPALYAGARALVFPSHYEGFGLPPLEMLATGGAVIASTAAAHREVLGTHAHFIDADDVDGWHDALVRAASDNDWIQSIRAGAREQARRFSWARCVEATSAVYRNLGVRRAAA